MTRTFYIFLLSCVGTIVGSFAFGQSSQQTLIKGKLKNGLTYYVRPNAYPTGEAVYRLFLKTGSLAEKEAQKGLAHFLEHMAFNGTKHFPGDSLVRFLELQGAKFGKDLNAHTSYNETVYKLQLPSKDTSLVDMTLTILADWAGGLTLDSVAVEKERKVIYSEWLSRKSGNEAVNDAFLNALFNGSRYADRKVIGDTAVILHAPAQQLRDYYNDWYNPGVMAVAVVGDIDAEWVTGRIKEKFGRIPVGKKKLKEWPIPNYRKNTFKQVISDGEKKAELNIIRLLNLPRPVRNKKEYKDYMEEGLLRMLLRKRWSDLSFDNPTYSKASVQSSGFLNTKQLLTANLVINPDKPDSSVIEFAMRIAQLAQYGFDKNEIATVKKSYEAQLKNKAESKRPTSSAVLMDELYDDFYKRQPVIAVQDEYNWYMKNVDRIDSVSLLRHFQQWYNPDKAYYLLTGYPQIEAKLPSEADILKWFKDAQRKKQPRYHKAMDLVENLIEDRPTPATVTHTEQRKAVNATEVKLSNGVNVIFRRPVLESDRVTVTGFRKGGLYTLDSADYVSGLYAGQIVALSGAGDLSRESLNHYLTGKSASVRFLIDKTRSGIAGSAENSDSETLFQLIYLKWTAPRLDQAIFAQVKEKAIDSYRHTNQTPAATFGRDLGYLLNGYDYITRELTDSVIERELLADRTLPVFDRAFGAANGFTFIVTGDPEDEHLQELVNTYIGGLPTGTVDTTYRYSRHTRLVPATFEKYVGETAKASVWLSYQTTDIPMDHQTYELMNDAATAVLQSQLLKELREEMGMVYSVSVSGSATPYPDPLARTSIRFSCKPEDVDILIQTVQKRMLELVENPASIAATLEDVKSNLRKEMALNKQRDSFWSSYIRNSLFNNEGSLDFVSQYDTLVDRISVMDVADFVRTQIMQTPLIRAVLYPKSLKK
ncbi:insulinase family protein [Sphingobacterium olei]|uniref:Insulinase family protein n=1 Tax=Sphingobacterium olei TaxID=2571155 RepID=A0A4U0P6B1_9SPHI|nr:M16 family metallopeptidase [Sphingobacterium olei]TJZ62953.1 insulinase family protein [Sphingobacterium olei]